MPNSLANDLRNLLARVTLEARGTAERAAGSALENLAVHEKDYRPHMSSEQRELRNRLRERGRALGDLRDERTGRQGISHLTEDVAYEHWHRLLFTRFLAENGLLRTDGSQGDVPITLAECDELASDLGARDGFELACRFSSHILPGVFRPDDPVFELSLAVNDQVELRQLLNSLPRDVFLADDSLGWTYQFWQAKRKDEVNASGKKIGADELPAVTQLFTEDYMVEFLLHNTLGAWWAGKLGSIQATTEQETRAKAGLPLTDGVRVDWRYLRLIEDEQTKEWKPAAGAFEHWPTAAKDIKFLDPCMGSGHFLVFVLPLLARLRMQEERLTAKKAVYAVLRDNLHGLEIDLRCAQIGAFNVALTAWKLGGYQPLPPLQVACSGLAPHTTERQWVSLAADNERLKLGMARLYALFKDAPILGSLIDPRGLGGDLLEAEFHELQPLLDRALSRKAKDDPAREIGVIARGIAKAAEILAGQFTLVATNVPYLGRGKQDSTLQGYCEGVYPESKADLATCFLERCISIGRSKGTTAIVTPQSWLFMGTYKHLRPKLLASSEWNFVARLGPGAFETIGGEVVNVALLGLTRCPPEAKHNFLGIDVAQEKTPNDKATGLRLKQCQTVLQSGQIRNPDSRISFNTHISSERLSKYCSSFLGLGTGDYSHYGRCFWEFPRELRGWAFQQCTVETPMFWGGREHMIAWDHTTGRVRGMTEAERVQIHNQDQSGQQAWGRKGVAVGLMQDLRPTLYTGEPYEKALAVLMPTSQDLIPALWAYCSDSSFNEAVRELEHNVIVANGTLVKVPFDVARWNKVAAEKYPLGLPRPFSSDPTQWLFDGQPKDSDQPLHVAVARLLGYEWPRQTGSKFPDCPALGQDGLEKLADEDGIVCLAAINREQPAVHRLRALLARALGKFDERTLLASAGAKGSNSATLEEWLRDEFFEQHCGLFHHRPFIWHIWDGRRDGFSALVNYHKLDYAALQKLTYNYLGDWIRHQEEDAKADKAGADARLGAARALQSGLAKILEGDAPYDIFIRWKPLSKQPSGWHPDLNDGVRLNIRPFATADILRKRVKIKWDKDRGKEPYRENDEYPWFWCEIEPDTDPEPGRQFTGHRWNGVHLTIQRKRRARGGK